MEFTQLAPNIITHEDQSVAMAAFEVQGIFRKGCPAVELTKVGVRIGPSDATAEKRWSIVDGG